MRIDRSDNQIQLFEYISTLVTNVKSNVRILDGKEIDIYLPDLKIGFEYNGLYWHSNKYKDIDYHLDKTNKCLDMNISLIHIYEDDWLFKGNIVKSMILNKIDKITNIIHSNRCKIDIIHNKEISYEFLNNNHIKSYIECEYNIGLYFKNELVSLISFKHLNNNVYELVRFCDVNYYNIVDSTSKLFKYFLKTHTPIKIISYSDNSYSNGSLYKTLRFEFDSHIDINYQYVIDKKRCYDKIKENTYKIWDCGQNKWIFYV